MKSGEAFAACLTLMGLLPSVALLVLGEASAPGETSLTLITGTDTGAEHPPPGSPSSHDSPKSLHAQDPERFYRF